MNVFRMPIMIKTIILEKPIDETDNPKPINSILKYMTT